MKRKGTLWIVGWILFGLLAIATGLILLGKREYTTEPSAYSYGPSGTHALVELLRAEGYSVEISRALRPKLESGDLALGFYVRQNRYGMFDSTEEDAPTGSASKSPAEKAIYKHLQQGGRALVCQLPESFMDASRIAFASPTRIGFELGSDSDSYRVSIGSRDEAAYPSPPIEVESKGFTLASDEQQNPVLRLYDEGSGILGVVFGSVGCTNRFIGIEQNAEFLLKVIRALSPIKGRIVVVEALGGQAVQPGLLATIGSWASAAWWQLILVFIVIVFTLGKRFGLPEISRYQQRGGRELVDAYADVMLRTRRPNIALKKVVGEIDREVRKRFSISADLSPKRRNEVLPAALATALSRAETAADSALGDSAAVKLLKDLEKELSGLRGETQGRRRRKR